MSQPAAAAAPAPRVALVGAGTIGRGWAALFASAAWDVTLFDIDTRVADFAIAEVARRARALGALGRAVPETVEAGLRRVRVVRSLLQACREADWVIESVTEDLHTKQHVFENIALVAKPDAIISSSSSGLAIGEIIARVRNQQRCLVAHALNPPELIPLVEIVPGKLTAPLTVDTIRAWLRSIGRISITLRREVPGHVVGRIAAAVWRECIDLVLSGVVDVDDIDRAVSLGPGLGWAAAGPHLTYHLAAGDGGVALFLQQLLQSLEGWWGSLAQWSKLEPEQTRALVQQIEGTYGQKVDMLREARDRRLAAMLKALEAARKV